MIEVMKSVTVDTIEIDWKMRALLKRRIEIDLVKETQNLYMGIVLGSLFGQTIDYSDLHWKSSRS